MLAARIGIKRRDFGFRGVSQLVCSVSGEVSARAFHKLNFKYPTRLRVFLDVYMFKLALCVCYYSRRVWYYELRRPMIKGVDITRDT